MFKNTILVIFILISTNLIGQYSIEHNCDIEKNDIVFSIKNDTGLIKTLPFTIASGFGTSFIMCEDSLLDMLIYGLMDVSPLRVKINNSKLTNPKIGFRIKCSLSMGLMKRKLMDYLKKQFKFEILEKEIMTRVYKVKIVDLKKYLSHKDIEIPKKPGITREKDNPDYEFNTNVNELAYSLERAYNIIMTTDELIRDEITFIIPKKNTFKETQKFLRKEYGILFKKGKEPVTFYEINFN